MQSVLMTCLLTEHQIVSIENHSYNAKKWTLKQ